ncbi:hypothetical protein THAOC_11488 [Thalassiosira oceanica]|uniref:Ketoreductase (KR) domain-containing protein n=1 Tax=Thalassiosira oceanica TaxID=159749 RepID=K0TAC2_THAOC|nr:hypothetical protein THAOC_11488 [Thalassiosira oceanica]|eukprot:EJK67472.1 hypothetical protein THAOC_11488 [Thalassiosira oceanica]
MDASKTLFIAGGTDGIGLSLLALELKRAQYSKVFVLGRDFRKVDQLLSENDNTLSPARERLVKVPCDITCLGEMESTLSSIGDHSIHDFVSTIGTYHRGKIADIEVDTSSGAGSDIVADHFHLNCVSIIHLIRLMIPKLVRGASQILICTASLATLARSPYSLQSATKTAIKAFIDTLRIELKGDTRVMNIMPPSLDTRIFAKGGDFRSTDDYPPPSRVADTMQYMLDCPFDICIPEILIEQHQFEVA